MSVPTHFRFVVRGTFKNTPEQWSTSTHFIRTNEGSGDAGLDDINEGDITAAVVAFFQSSNFQSSVSLGDWRMYVIGTDNHMEGNGPLLHVFEPPLPSGSGQLHRFPPQVSLVHTLVADNRGPAKLGRMYMPGPNYALESDGRISDADADTAAEALTTLLKAISDAIDLTGLNSSSACNVSPGPAGSTTGTLQQVDHIETGRVLDTLRNRRKSMLEERHVHGQIDW